jgi:hypothetical protein
MKAKVTYGADGRLDRIEYRSLTLIVGASYHLYYGVRARYASLGDGVDMFTDANDNALIPDTPEFDRALVDMLVSEYNTLLEAHFGL